MVAVVVGIVIVAVVEAVAVVRVEVVEVVVLGVKFLEEVAAMIAVMVRFVAKKVVAAVEWSVVGDGLSVVALTVIEVVV